jgi:hypothetical protein
VSPDLALQLMRARLSARHLHTVGMTPPEGVVVVPMSAAQRLQLLRTFRALPSSHRKRGAHEAAHRKPIIIIY